MAKPTKESEIRRQSGAGEESLWEMVASPPPQPKLFHIEVFFKWAAKLLSSSMGRGKR